MVEQTHIEDACNQVQSDSALSELSDSALSDSAPSVFAISKSTPSDSVLPESVPSTESVSSESVMVSNERGDLAQLDNARLDKAQSAGAQSAGAQSSGAQSAHVQPTHAQSTNVQSSNALPTQSAGNQQCNRLPVGPRAVGIVGLGLIGGSLARRLVSRGFEVSAWNHRDHPYAQAEADGIHCVPTLADLAAAKPNVIVLCNPLKAMPSVLEVLRSAIDPSATTLTDVGSVKGMVRDQVTAAGLAACYVGAHPMAGNEFSGWDAADPTLYDDALWALSVDDATDYMRFLTVARMIVEGCGNRIIVLDDYVHDRAAALISHMPHVVATALINELVGHEDRNIAAALAAGSWRDMTRVALTDPNRTRAMVEEDAENVEQLLRSVSARLVAVADALRDGDDTVLTDFFAAGQPFRDYKAAQRVENASYDKRAVHIDRQHWQADLLMSARRGEHIVAFDGPYDVRVAVRSAL